MPFTDYTDFATSDSDAKKRYLLAKKSDPFPEIAHALLNSADISDYVRVTGMLYPFHSDKVKSASYEASIRGRCIWWDENGNRHEQLLQEDEKDQFVLKANSIAFVQVEPCFRLPDYVALRFNLKITHVHRGILLGTGPLVDPGFEGHLLIPLHNLTTNDYTIACGEGLIWIEFTKTSPVHQNGHGTNSEGLARRGNYIEFPGDKKYKEPEYYLLKASPHNPIRSSIPEAVRESRAQATRAAQEAKRTRRIVEWFMGIGGVIFLLTLAGVTYQTWSLIQDAWKAVTGVQYQLRQDMEKAQGLARETEENRKKIQLLEQRLPNEVSTGKDHPRRMTNKSSPPGNHPDTNKSEDQKPGAQPRHSP